MPDYVGAVDQGTTSTRFMIFDHSGSEVARHQIEHEQILPQSGWVEHDPVEIWERTSSVIQSGMNKANVSAADIAARMGLTKPEVVSALAAAMSTVTPVVALTGVPRLDRSSRSSLMMTSVAPAGPRFFWAPA